MVSKDYIHTFPSRHKCQLHSFMRQLPQGNVENRWILQRKLIKKVFLTLNSPGTVLNIYKVVKLDLTSVLREIRPPKLLPENHRKRGGEARIVFGRIKIWIREKRHQCIVKHQFSYILRVPFFPPQSFFDFGGRVERRRWEQGHNLF